MTLAESGVNMKGPKGSLAITLSPFVGVDLAEGGRRLQVSMRDDSRDACTASRIGGGARRMERGNLPSSLWRRQYRRKQHTLPPEPQPRTVA